MAQLGQGRVGHGLRVWQRGEATFFKCQGATAGIMMGGQSKSGGDGATEHHEVGGVDDGMCHTQDAGAAHTRSTHQNQRAHGLRSPTDPHLHQRVHVLRAQLVGGGGGGPAQGGGARVHHALVQAPALSIV